MTMYRNVHKWVFSALCIGPTLAYGATYPSQIPSSYQKGDFIAKRGVERGRTAILETLGPYLVNLPEGPGSSSSGITPDYKNTVWNLSDLTNPTLDRVLGNVVGPIDSHGTLTRYFNDRPYLYTKNNTCMPDEDSRICGGDYLIYNENETGTEQLSKAYLGLNTHWLASPKTYANLTSPYWLTNIWSYMQGDTWRELTTVLRLPDTRDAGLNNPDLIKPGEPWLGNQVSAEWDHYGITGVTGFPIRLGNHLVYASDQQNTGIAIYDMTGFREGDLNWSPLNNGQPVTFNQFTEEPHPNPPPGSPAGITHNVGIGGYWAEPYGTDRIVFAARRDDLRYYSAIYIVSIADPSNPELTCHVTFDQDSNDPTDGDITSDPMYINFQDQYAYVDHFQVDINRCEELYYEDNSREITASEFDQVVYKFEDIANSCEMNQYFRPLGQVGAFGGYDFGGSQYKITYTGTAQTMYGSPSDLGTHTFNGDYFDVVYSPSPGVSIISRPVTVGETVRSNDTGDTFTITSIVSDESVNEQGTCFFVTSDQADTNPPYISGHIPRDNQTNYPVDGYVHIHIPETLRKETVSNAVTFESINGDPVAFKMQLSHTGTLGLFPLELLQPNTSYQVSIAGIQDFMGNTMTPDAFTFSTGSATPPPPVISEPAPTEPAPSEPVPSEPVPSEPAPTVIDTSSSDWAFCSTENNVCSLPYETSVRYGADATYITLENVVGSQVCSNAAFGSDPIPGVLKQCEYQIVSLESTPDTPTPPPTEVTPSDSGPAPSLTTTPYYPNQSSQLACEPERGLNGTVWAVNPDNDSVAIIRRNVDSSSFELRTRTTREIKLGYEHPSSVSKVNNSFAVTYRDDDKVVFFSSQGFPTGSIDTGHGTQPVASVARGNILYVALYGSGEVIKVEASTGEIISRIDVGPTPKAMSLNADGSRLLVTRFISTQNYGEVYDIATSGNMSLTRTIRVNKVQISDSPENGSGVPNFLSSIVLTPDETIAYITATKANVDRGRFRSQADLDDDNTVRPMIAILDLVNNRDAYQPGNGSDGTIDLDNAADPYGITFLPDGVSRVHTLQGNDKVVLRNLNASTIAQTGVGLAPQSMCTTLRTLFIKNFSDRSVTAVDISGWMHNGSTDLSTQSLSTVRNEVLSAEELQGLQVFYSARMPDISPEGYISCASCHAGGGHDGMVWDMTQMGEGLRNTISLNGASGIRFGNLHWSSNFDEVQDFEIQIERLNGGTFSEGLIPGFFGDNDNPLNVTTAGESEDLDALAAYLSSLGKSSVKRSPYRTYTGELTPAALRGQALFEADNCSDCHSTQAYRDGQNHDVGTIKASSGGRLGFALTGIRTPSLIELWDSAPYYHDGSAATLSDVFDVGIHQRNFSGTQEIDLIEFLNSIDRELYIDDNTPFNPQ